jgi:MauM/NapG family ferredoxin protein
VAACKNSGLDFKFSPPWHKTETGSVDLTKRATVAAVVGGIATMSLIRVTPQAQARTFNPVLIRPPGSRAEREFLQRCIQCGMCMKVCPTGGLQPTWHEAGLEGVWTPLLVPRIGWCEYECHLCGQVCPTEAIAPLPLAEKKQVKIGLATIDTTRCLPYAYNRDCIVCEEHCPIPEKAIFFVTREVTQRDGTTRPVKQPEVDPDLCTGCGICETKCPFTDLPAIRVTSAGESRHPDNQPVLPPSTGYTF